MTQINEATVSGAVHLDPVEHLIDAENVPGVALGHVALRLTGQEAGQRSWKRGR
jgi:hypothetical protein